MTAYPILTAASAWPRPLDQAAIALFVATVIALPLLGYWLIMLDIRAYLRALRGALIRIASFGGESVPDWLADETPPCLRALGLSLPCTEQDVKQAYRERAKELHPDRGGDVRQFLQLQDHHEQAHFFLRQQQEPQA